MTNVLTVSAVRFRIALTISLFLSVAIMIGVVTYGVKYLNSYADKVNLVAVEASNTDSRIDIMRQEAQILESYKGVAERARQIVAESQSYEYQDVIIRDLEEFARRAGVSVQTYDFTSGQIAPQGGATGTSAPTQPTGSGPKSTTVSVTISNPVDYRSLLRFIYQIEQNLTKMQISNVTMSSNPGGEGGQDSVNSSNFVIQVYIR